MLHETASEPATRARVALLEDDHVMGEALRQRLTLEGYDVQWWRSGQEGLDGMAALRPDLLVCDIRLPDMDGEALFHNMNRRPAAPPVLFITAYGDLEQAVRLMREGAGDYVTKPFALDDFLSRMERLIAGLADRGAERPLLGVSPAMQRVEALLRRVADVESTVLFAGETGVGKEVAARLLHDLGRAEEGPFMAVNCAAIPRDLLESELFGHEKGAFTGALGRHEGYAERAGRGTLFLDEIGELPLDLQAKLLRLLQERSFTRVGGERALPFRARLMAASNHDLARAVAEGRFRADLWYRVNVIAVELPPLRLRAEDVLLLARRFLAQFSEQLGRDALGFASAAEEALLAHDWPGNVRELRNRIERAVALSERALIAPGELFPEVESALSGAARLDTLAEVRDAAERRQIRRALALADGHPGKAAELLGISRTTLWEKQRRLGIAVI